MPSPLPDSTQTTKSLDAFSVTFQAYRLDQLTYFLLSVKNFDHHYTKRKPTCNFFSISSSIYVWWWTWSSILRAEQEFFFFTHVFCEDLSLKSCFDLWRPFLLSLLWYLLVFCALQKCKCVCISVDVYFVVVHKMFIL